MDLNIRTDERTEQEATKLCSLIKEAIPSGTDKVVIALAVMKIMADLVDAPTVQLLEIDSVKIRKEEEN